MPSSRRTGCAVQDPLPFQLIPRGAAAKMSAMTPRRTPIMAPKTDVDRPGHHLRPVLTVLAFLVPMVGLTVYYYDQTQPAPFVPSNLLVLALLNGDLILLVVLVLLLPRNLVKAYFERRQQLL